MKRIVLLFALLTVVFSVVAQKDVEVEPTYYSEYSTDSTMIYKYYDKSLFRDSFVEIYRADSQEFTDDQFSEKPYWFEFKPYVVKSHWNTCGKEVDVILDELKIMKGTLLVRLFYSLRTGNLVTMRLLVNKDIAPLLDRLPLEEIFSIYESIDTSQFITIYKHEPCEEDDKYTIFNVRCR